MTRCNLPVRRCGDRRVMLVHADRNRLLQNSNRTIIESQMVGNGVPFQRSPSGEHRGSPKANAIGQGPCRRL